MMLPSTEENKKPWDDRRYFFGGPTQQQAKRIAWNDFKDLIPKDWIDGRPSESDLCIHTIFGSELWVVGMDAPQRVEGSPWDYAVIDESSDQKAGSFDRCVYPALSDRNGGACRTGVPKRVGPGAQEYKEAYDYARAKGVGSPAEIEGASDYDPEWEAFHWVSEDILDPKVIRAAKRVLDPKTYREQYQASFETAGGQIYSAFGDFNKRPCYYQPGMTIHVGNDFNVNPMTAVLFHVYGKIGAPEAHIEVFDEVWLENSRTQLMLDHVWSKYGPDGKNHRAGWCFFGDATSQARKTAASSTDFQQIQNDPRFKEAGRTVHYPKANPGCANRYATVNAMCENAIGRHRLFVDPVSCPKLVRDLESVYYEPGTTEAAKVGDLTHITDALGYPIVRMFPITSHISESPPDARFGV